MILIRSAWKYEEKLKRVISLRVNSITYRVPGYESHENTVKVVWIASRKDMRINTVAI